MNLRNIFSYCWYLWGHYMVQSSSSPPHCEAWQPTAKGNNPPLTSVMQHPLLWHFLLKNTSTNIMIGPPKYHTPYWNWYLSKKESNLYGPVFSKKHNTMIIDQSMSAISFFSSDHCQLWTRCGKTNEPWSPISAPLVPPLSVDFVAVLVYCRKNVQTNCGSRASGPKPGHRIGQSGRLLLFVSHHWGFTWWLKA